MQCQNHELTTSLFFVSNDEKRLAYAQDLVNPKLNQKVYYHPTSYPKIERLDSRAGSCFSDWHVPTESYIFDVVDGRISGSQEVEIDLSLTEYQQFVEHEIRDNIVDLYSNNNTVNLLYSGSSDSTVVLSYIMQLGLANRTRLVCVNNTATTHPDALRYNQTRINRIDHFFQTIGRQFADTVWETSGLDDIVELINLGNSYFHLQSYNIAGLFNRYQDQAWVSGLHGNRTLLHHWTYLDQHRILLPESIPRLKHDIETQHSRVYSPSIKRMNFDRAPIPSKYITHCVKPVHRISGYRGNVLYSPLGTERIFQNLRRLNPAEVNFDIVANAAFNKNLIKKNQPELLSWMDKSQTSHEFINIEHVNIPTDTIDYNQLQIPLTLNHNDNGLAWLQEQIMQSKKTGVVELNTLMSIKNLQLIHQELNKCN